MRFPLAKLLVAIAFVVSAACDGSPLEPLRSLEGRLAPSLAGSEITLTDLGLLDPTGRNYGLAINDLGAVVGESGFNNMLPMNGRAFHWSADGGYQLIGTLGGTHSSPRSINNAGTVVGTSSLYPVPPFTPITDLRAFTWTAATGMQEIPGLPAGSSTAYDINESGQVVGRAGATAFLYDPSSGITDLGTLPGGTGATPMAISDAGHVVGQATLSDLVSRSFIWTAAGGMRELGLDGGTGSSVHDVNSSGDAVGVISSSTEGWQKAVLWRSSGEIVDLGSLGGNWTTANSINEKGEVVGWGRTAGAGLHAFVWTAEDGLIRLPELPGAFYSFAHGITETGLVAGTSSNSFGDSRAVLWTISTPTPEQRITNLMDRVSALATDGTLSAGQASALTAKLSAAMNSVTRGNQNAARGQLGAFTNQCETLVRSGALSAATAEGLIAAAASVIEALQ